MEKIMKIKKLLFLLSTVAVCCLSLATSSFAIDVKTDFDRATDFGRYKTFCWQKVETRNPLWTERIKTAVSSVLTAKGWSQAESNSGCDVALVATEMKRNHDTVNTFYDNFGGGWGGWGWRGFGGGGGGGGWGGGGEGETTTTRDTYRTGTFSVDVSDKKTRGWVGRGSARDTLPNKSKKKKKK